MDLDDVLDLEEQFYKEGLAEGQAESTKKSPIEGKEYGLQVGFQRFIIVGIVEGLVARTKYITSNDELSSQAESHLKQLQELTNLITINNDYGNVIETEKILTKIRNKLRVLTNVLPTKKSLTLKEIDEVSKLIAGIEEESKSQPSIGNLNDETMW